MQGIEDVEEGGYGYGCMSSGCRLCGVFGVSSCEGSSFIIEVGFFFQC